MDKNNRSPRVVSNLNQPTLGPPPGWNYSHTPIAVIKHTKTTKNMATGVVHAIQDKSIANSPILDLGQIPWRCSYEQNK